MGEADRSLAEVCIHLQVTWLTWAHGTSGTSEFRDEHPRGPMLAEDWWGPDTNPHFPISGGRTSGRFWHVLRGLPGLLAGPGPAAPGGHLLMHHRPWPLSFHTSFPSMTGVTTQMHFQLQVPILGLLLRDPKCDTASLSKTRQGHSVSHQPVHFILCCAHLKLPLTVRSSRARNRRPRPVNRKSSRGEWGEC